MIAILPFLVGQDFEVQDSRTTHDLTFSADMSTQCVNISIVDDSRTEDFEEEFDFMLVQRDTQAMLGVSSGSVTIIDNDSK